MALIDRRRSDLMAMLIGCTAALTAVAFSFTTPARSIESLTYDLRMALAAPPPAEGLVIIKMDDRAVEEMRAQSPCALWLVCALFALPLHRHPRAAPRGARGVGAGARGPRMRLPARFSLHDSLGALFMRCRQHSRVPCHTILSCGERGIACGILQGQSYRRFLPPTGGRKALHSIARSGALASKSI